MNDGKLFEYDKNLFDRSFLNCGQRHVLVRASDFGKEVSAIFHNALVSPGLIAEQIICNKSEKYEFTSSFFDEAILTANGILVREKRYSSFQDFLKEYEPLANRFYLISGDVYYLPHCPEYLNKHLSHFALIGELMADQAILIDDDKDSILRTYHYGLKNLSDFFDNDTEKTVLEVTLTDSLPSDDAQLHSSYIEQLEYEDPTDFMISFIESPFDSCAVKSKILHDFYSLLHGSRKTYYFYRNKRGLNNEITTALFAEVQRISYSLKIFLLRSPSLQKLNSATFLDAVRKLHALDSELIDNIKCYSKA